MKARFLSFAREELTEATAYYHDISPSLGRAFRQEARHVTQLIVDNPEAWHPLKHPFRHCRFHRFPYALIYEARVAEIIIVAVAHLQRRPGYWHERADR